MGDYIELNELSFGFNPSDVDSFDLGVNDLRDQKDIEYPAILLSGILFSDCIRLLQSKKRPSYREMDVWIEMPDDGGFQKIGTLQIDSDILLLLHTLHIRATLYLSKDDVETLDLSDPDTIERFI